MIEILQEHFRRYPLMQIQDMAKLIFQNEFGGGHMITNPQMSLKRIQEEYAFLNEAAKNHTPKIESIGDDMCRIYLSALSEDFTVDMLNNLFVTSANQKRGTKDSLEMKLDSFVKACEDHLLPYSKNEVCHFIEHWKSQGYPAISHSEIYRKNYHPAYRVVNKAVKSALKLPKPAIFEGLVPL